MIGRQGKTLLVIGAGTAQMTGIQIAKKKGCKIVAIDGDAGAPGLGIADVGIVLDVKDCNGAIKLAKEYHVDGVLAIASEISLPAVAAVNEALCLPGLKPIQVKRATDKGLMRKRFAEYGIPSTPFAVLKEKEEIKAACRRTGFPAVIKPVDNAGSRGVHYVDSLEQIMSIFNSVKGYSRSREVILESFMSGTEISVEAFVANGEITFLTLSDKDRTSPPYLLDTAVKFPSAFPDSIQAKAKDIATLAIHSLELDNCPIHMELMITPDGPRVVEMAARGPGFKVYTDIIPYVTGVHGVEAQISLLLGEKPRLQPQLPLRGACIFFFSGKQGKVKNIKNLETVKARPDIYDMDIYVKPGDPVHDLTSGTDRIGHVITLAETREKACRAAMEAYQTVVIEIEEEEAE